MTTEWNKEVYRFESKGGKDSGSFDKHHGRMREFRSSHTNVATANGARLDEPALLARMRRLPVSRIVMETGGSKLPADITGWSTLIPLWKVVGYKLSLN